MHQYIDREEAITRHMRADTDGVIFEENIRIAVCPTIKLIGID